MKIERNDIYGGSLILSYMLKRDYNDIGDELTYFISFQEFDKYIRYIDYGVPLSKILAEVKADIESLNEYTKSEFDISKVVRWITVNFGSIYLLVSGAEDEDDD